MKRLIIFKAALLLFNILSIAQTNDCNRDVWVKQDAKKLPKEICIPKGDYHISEIYKKTDVNGDGYKDFIFDWNKKILQDGDTIFVTIYLQNPDSTFTFFRTFNNLYPIYFKRYDMNYMPEDEQLKNIHRKYMGEYLLLKLTFEKDAIEITRKGDATANLIIIYRYDKNVNNWRYEKTIMHDFSFNTKEPYDLSEKIGPTIDDFTYFIWD